MKNEVDEVKRVSIKLKMVKCLLEFSDFPIFCQDVIKDLRVSEHFADVTLIGDDDIPVKAHKIVLCAHSSVLKDAILSLGYERIVLQCKGFKSQDIRSLLDFIYLGVVSSEYKDANILFKLGKFLQIRHLGEECDLSLEELDKKFHIEAIEDLREENVKSECIEETGKEAENAEKSLSIASTSAQIVFKATAQDIDEKQSDFDTFFLDTQSISDETEREERIINVKNFDLDCKKVFKDKKQSKVKAKSTKYHEGSVVRMYNSVMESFAKVDPSKTWKPLDETDEDELKTNLCKFFMCLVKPDGRPYGRDSKKTYFSALKRYLIETRNIYLERGAGRYQEVYDIVYNPWDDDDDEAIGGTPFREEDIEKCFSAGTIGHDNPKALLTLVMYFLMSNFDCNTRKEVYNLVNSDFIYGPLNNSKEPEYVQLSERVLKLRKDYKYNNRIGRIELDGGVPLLGNCPVRTLLFYQKMKTPKQLEPDQPFLLNPARNAQQQPTGGHNWFDNLRLGINSIGKVFKTALLEAGVDLTGQKITLSSAKKPKPRPSS